MSRVYYLPSLFSAFFLFALFCIIPVHADEISDAVNWLETQTNVDGSYAGSLDVSFPAQSTAEVLRSYHELNQESLAGVANAKSFIDTQGDEKTEILARKIIAKAEAGGDTAPLLAKLIALQNPDGGFGDQAGYQSRVIDTTFALNALGVAQSGNSDAIGRAISYLLNEQAADGGFSHSSVNQNSVYETALASIALQYFRFNYNLTVAIDGASDFLLKNQLTSGDWGSSWETAYALLALIPVTSDVQLYQPGVNNLKTSQVADGSWGQDVYATALALRAIHKAANIQIPQDPTTGTFTGQMFNADTGQPLQGVTVKLTDVAGFELVSSADGSFSMEGVSPGEHTLSYSAAGFTSVTQTATIVVGKFTSLGTIQLTPLVDKGVVFGVVRDAQTNQPLTSVTVNISGSTNISVSTDNNGFFTAEVEPGQITLSTDISGYDPVSGNADIAAGQRLNFSPLLNLTGTTPAVTTVKTKVTVVDATTNLPIEGVQVSILGTSISGTTNNEGKLVLDNITAGSLTIELSATGYQTVLTSTLAPAGSVIDLGVVSLNEKQTATKRTVKGFVTDAVTGNPVSGATVKVEGTSISVITNAEGYYLIEDTGLAVFNLVSSAVGYLENRGEVRIDQPGQVSVNIQLGQAQISKVNISSVQSNLSSYPANTKVEVDAQLNNEDSVDRKVRLFIVVINSSGTIIEQFPAKIIPVGGNINDVIEIIPAAAKKTVEVKWQTGLNPPGSYQFKVQAIDADTNQLLSEKATQIQIEATKRIGGGASFDPPIVQRVANGQVRVEALIQNTGNQLIQSGNVTATVTLVTQGNERSSTFGEVTKTDLPNASTNLRKMDADQQGNLYIADYSGKKILRVASNGDTTNLLEIANINPVDVDVAPNGKVYIVDQSGDIFDYDPQTGISNKTYDSNISGPTSLEVLLDGRILVGTNSRGVFEIATDGAVSNIQKSGMGQPQDLVKNSQGALFVADQTGVIFKYANGILSQFVGADSNLGTLQGITIDSADNLYIAAFAKNQILKITPDKQISVYADNVKTPWGLSFNTTGRLLVTSNNGNELIAINSDGTQSVIVEETINNPNHLVHTNDGFIYVIDAARNLVKFDSQGNKVALFNAGLSSIQDMLFESHDRILALQSSRLYAVSGVDGSKQEIATGFSGATSIARNPNGNGYIISESGGKLSLLASDGSKSSYMKPAFSAPINMVIAANGDKYILNSTYITKIAPTGQVSRVVEGLSSPQDMAVDNNGNAFVTEYYKKRLIKIDKTGVVTEIATFDFNPRKLALKNDGGFYLLKSDSRTIYSLDAGVSTKITQFDWPISSIKVASDNSLWVKHSWNYNRISKLASDGTTQTFSIQYPTSITFSTSGGIDVLTRNQGLKHIDNNGQITDIFANNSVISSQIFKSIIKDGNNYWLLLSKNKLIEIDSAGNTLNSYASSSAIRDFVLQSDSSIIIADQSNILKISASNQLPTIIKPGTFNKINKIGSDNLLLSTRNNVQKLQISSGNISTLISGFNSLVDVSVSLDNTNIVTLDSTRNEIGFHDASGANQGNHVGLVKPKAILYTSDGNIIVSNGLPNKIMKVVNGNLSLFSDMANVTHLNNIQGGKISASSASVLNILKTSGQIENRVGTYTSNRSALIPDGTGWFAITNTNKLLHINPDESSETLAAGIGNVVDIETDSTGNIYLLDSSRKSIFISEASGGLKLLNSELSSAISFDFDDNDGLYIIESAQKLSNLNLTTLKKSSISSAPLIYRITGITLSKGEIKAVGRDRTTGKSVIYTIGIDNSGSNIAPGTVVYTKTISSSELVVGSKANTYDFESFIPPVSGDYKVIITHSDGTVSGQLQNTLHVGGAALGTISLAKNQVFPGDRLVAGSISITGADSTSVTKLEPENVVLAASTGANGRGIASDSSGNIFAAYSNGIKKVTTDGTVSNFVTGITLGNGMSVDSSNNIYAGSGSKLMKITANAQVTTLATLSSTVVGVAIDSQNQVYAMVQNGELVKINSDGSTEVVMSGIQTPSSLSIDAFDNFYVLSGNIILRLNPARNATAIAYTEPGLYFEHEGVNVIADCSNNILFAPFTMPSVGFNGEEAIIAQVTGNTGEARQIFYGPDIDPALRDMDVLYYDRFNDRVLVWTDLGSGKVFAFPVSCGGVDVEAHIIASDVVDVNAFDPAPTRTETTSDGLTEYVWVLSQVDNRGSAIEYNAQFNGMKEGERRKVFKDAFLLFTNSFVQGQQVKTPLFVPELLAKSESGLTTSTDKSTYSENQDVQISLLVHNQNDALLNGTIKIEILDQSGIVVESLADVVVRDVPALGEVSLSAVWNTALTLKGDYKAVATLLSSTGLILQTSQASFAISNSATGNTPQATLRLTLDKPVYSTSDQISLGSLSHNITANVLIQAAMVKIKILKPDGSLYAELEQTVGDLASGNLRQLNSLQALNSVGIGSYSVTAELLDADQTVLATAQTQFDVAEQRSLTISGQVAVAQQSIFAGAPQQCLNTINNNGSISLDNAVFRQVLVNVDTATETIFADQQVTAIATGSQYQFTSDIDTSALAQGQYSCILQRKDGTDWQTLAFQFFKVDMLAMTASLDAAQYPANKAVNIVLKVDNPTDVDFSGKVKLTVMDENSNVITELTPVVAQVPATGSINLSASWNTVTTLAGNYKILASLINSADQNIELHTLPFEITAIINATLDLSVDQSSYLAGDKVKLSNLLKNTTLNKSLANAILKTVVKNTAGTVVYTQDTPLETLAPNASKTVALDFTLPADAMLGTYNVLSLVVKGSEQLAVITRTFDVIALGANLILKTDKASYLAKDTVKLTQRVKNTTVDKPLVNATLKTVVKNATGTVIYSKDTPLETLAPNVSKTVVLDFILPADAALGTYSIESQIIKGSEQLAVITRTFDVIALGATLRLETDKTAYLAGDTVKLTQVVKNSTVDKPLIGATLKTVVKNAAGKVVYSKDTSLETLVPNASKTIKLDFVLQTNSDPGAYHAESQLVNAMGQLAEASGTFEVIALSVSASLHVTTDKSAYLAKETVKLTSLIENTSLLGDLENATLKTIVKDSTGTVVLNKETSLNQLAPNASQTIDLDFSFAADAPLGTFTITSELIDSANKPLANAQTSFKLVADAMQAIVGTVSVLDKEIKPGDKQQCIGHVENTSDSDFAKLSIRHIVMPLGSSNELGHNDSSILLAKKSVKELIYALDNLTLEIGDYQCVLQAKIGGVYTTLDTSIFKVSDDVAPQEITLDVTTDKPEYEQGKQVNLKHLIENKTPAIPLQNAMLKVRVISPDGVTVFEQQKALNTLSAKGASLAKIALAAKADQSIVLDFTLPADAVLGNYTVTSQVLDASQTILSTDSAIFRVIAAVAPIPTLSEWSLLLLILSLGLSGFWTRRPRRLRIVKRR